MNLATLLIIAALPATVVYLHYTEPGRFAKGHLAAVTLAAVALTWSLSFRVVG